MDSESLNRCIQTALAALYPPFQATSPTVLCQVLSVVEACYRGDCLRYLIHFLLPAKQFLQKLQQEACSPFCGVVFRHEGWPLCVHEKVVVQLCPLNQRLLNPGDFYLLVAPPAALPQPHVSCRSSSVAPPPRLLLCSLSAGGRHVKQQEVSTVSLRTLFSMSWLDSINRDRKQRGAARLERCLLSTNGDVFRVPWEDLVYPQFISGPRTVPKDDQESSVRGGDTKSSIQEGKLHPPTTKTNQSAASSEGDDSEGEYVELTELPLPRFSPQIGSLTQSISLQNRTRTTTQFQPGPSKQNQNQELCRPVFFTHISSSDPPQEASRSQPVQTTGTGSEGSLDLRPEPETCSEQEGGENREEEEEDQKKERRREEEGEEGQRKEGSREEEDQKKERRREEGQRKEGSREEEEEEDEMKEGRIEEVTEMKVVHLINEEEEEEEEDKNVEEQQLEEAKWRRKDDEDGDDELEEEGPVEAELEEEVQVMIMKDSLERKEEEEVKKKDESGGEEERGDSERNPQTLLEEEKEEHSCKEAEGRRSPEHQNEGVGGESPSVLSEVCLSGFSPIEPEQPAAGPTVPVQSSQSRFHSVLLSSGAVCLPGTRDRGGRPLLTVCSSDSVWSNPGCSSTELLRLLLYYTSTLRKEVQALGLTVLVDARRAAPSSTLFSALQLLQEERPGSIQSICILVSKDSCVRLERPATFQVEVVSSLKSLQKHVEVQQLPAKFGGSFSFSQSSWISFRSRVEHLTNQCEDVITLLQETISTLQSSALPAAAQDAELQLSRYKLIMSSILADSRLVQLQQEGGASLAWLRREEGGSSASEDQRAAVETVSVLYDQVDELLHCLVTLSNSRTQELNFIVDFKSLEQGFSQVRTWLEEVGDVRLKDLDEAADSLELLYSKQQEFKDFYTTAYNHCKQGEELLARLDQWDNLSSADLHVFEVKVHAFWAQLQDFSQRVNGTGKNIERAVQLYRFLDQAYGWALEGMRHLAGISMEDCTLPDKCQAVIGCLEDYQRKHPPIPDGRFQDMKAEAGELRGERGLCQWSFAWSKCQETQMMFSRKMEAALKTRDSAHRRRSGSVTSRSSTSSRRTLSGLWGLRETSSCPPEKNTSPPTPQHTPLLQRLLRSSSSEESSDRVDMCSPSPSLPRLNSSPSFIPSSSNRRQQLRKAQSFDCPPTPEVCRCGPRALSEPVRHGNTGVFIRGLEVSSTEAADRTLCPRTAAPGWATPSSPGTPATESRPRGSKLRHIVEEMVTTEQEYVRSLRYIIHHYFPEMDRADVPQDLRGKRSVVFGNLEKLLDFHSQFFLRELEACWKHPLRVPHCFLRHQEQFSLYALYSKNKPKSDALLANHGHAFFRKKQLELGDKMDLSSYLLKPIQRMSKYALLLTDLMKEVGMTQEAELTALQAATNMVKFQLRHGNDLLAMDAIRDCDVNLKEQGQLIRQDEFTVWSGRRKCQRHIFLFEELVLFSKPKKMEGGLDVFIYKHSFKTADVGLTESTGDTGLKFEIWFRRRTSKNHTFILQAASADVKHAWTGDIARILWNQATRNKEMRLKEMLSMGVGNKPFLDIQPSDAAISNRAVHCIMKSRGARTRASIAVSAFDNSHPFKRGAGTSDPPASGPSSTSLLGPLNLHLYSQPLPAAPANSAFTSCVEEDEQETGSQPSMTTESSGSSSRCLSGSTGSDSGCVSSHLQEALPEEPRPHRRPSSFSSNKQHLNSDFITPKTAPVLGPASVI